MSYNTYNGWKLRGRQVLAGERGLFRNEYGDYMFSRAQTKPILDDYEVIVIKRDRYGRFVKQVRNY